MSARIQVVLLLLALLLFHGCGKSEVSGPATTVINPEKMTEEDVTISQAFPAVGEIVEPAGVPKITEAADKISLQLALKAKVDLDWPTINVEGLVRGGPPDTGVIVAQAKGPVKKGDTMEVAFDISPFARG